MSEAVESKQVDPSTDGGLPAIVTVEEVAKLLRVNRKTVYEAIKRREVPGVRRIGGTIRISRDAVLGWLEKAPASGARVTR